MGSHQLYIPAIILLAILACPSYGHWDGAYMYYENDGFNTRNNWMSNIRDDVRLCELAIPGSHDSGTYLLYENNHKTQVLNFDQQFNVGVRYFDVRLRHYNNMLRFLLSLGLEEFLKSVNVFLDNNPSETVIVRVTEKYEIIVGNTRSFADSLHTYLYRHSTKYFRTSDPSITLGNARGKFIIISDMPELASFGLTFSSFNVQHNSVIPTNWDLYSKWEAVKAQLYNAKDGNKELFYLNYLTGYGSIYPYFVASGHSSSGTGDNRLLTGLTTPGWASSYPDFPRVSCWWLFCSIAFEGLNVLTRNVISGFNQGSYPRTVGIIVANYPGDSLLSTIIENNKHLRKN